MFLAELHASGFRCFSEQAPLSLRLRRGLNILVGPNDAGKTAAIDAVRFALWTRGDDFQRLEASDFHVEPDGTRDGSLLIRCLFDGLTAGEQSRFMEWCTNEAGTLRLYICLRGTLRQQSGGGFSVLTQYRACKDADGMPVEGDLREYLRSTYLRPLRDAERELRSGRRSRLSKILGALPTMASQSAPAQAGAPATLVDTMSEADRAVEANRGVEAVQTDVNAKFLNDLSFVDDPLQATLSLGAKGSFDQLLERLELHLNPPPGQVTRLNRGLGYNNLLFMAAELLLLQSHPEQSPLLLIEEPEAHLHPQHQTLFMQVLEERSAEPRPNEQRQQVQAILSTHSPTLAASVNLDAMIMMIGHRTFPLAQGSTLLQPDDYDFLRRFLDATKANLFFARGLVIVEGDAENILLPAIARKIGRSFSKFGVSIVKVGHRGLFRYSRIFQRADGTVMPVKVSLLPDRDIPPDAAKALIGDRLTENEWAVPEKAAYVEALSRHQGGAVRAFPSEQWTLEFDLARCPDLANVVHTAIRLAQGAAGRTKDQIAADAQAEVDGWKAVPNRSADDIAARIFEPLHKKSVSKAEVAEQLAQLIDKLPDDAGTFRPKLPAYLVSAIEYATGG